MRMARRKSAACPRIRKWLTAAKRPPLVVMGLGHSGLSKLICSSTNISDSVKPARFPSAEGRINIGCRVGDFRPDPADFRI